MYLQDYVDICQEREINMNTYAIIKALARERHMDIRTFCTELNLPESTVYSWKSTNIPTLPIIIKIADYFNVSIDYLVGRTNQRKIAGNTNPLSPATLDLIHKIESANYNDNQAKIISKLIDHTESFDAGEDE